MDEFLELGTEYRYHLIDDLPGKVVGAFIQDPRRLCLTSKGIMEKITSVKDLINIDHDVASVSYGGLAGMLVATVKWAGISIREDQTAHALEILDRAMGERKRADEVVERYNRRFNVESKEV